MRPAPTQRIDGRGRFLIPELVDMHVHLFNNASGRPPNDWAFALFVANGVTAVREMAANTAAIGQAKRWNEAVVAGELVAPRILAAGITVHGPSAAEVAHQVAAARLAGADFIKVFSEVPGPTWRAIRDTAREQGLPIVGHVPAATSLLAAARDGLRENEHLMQGYEACSSVERELLDRRRGLDGTQLVALRDAQEVRTLEAFDQSTCDRVAEALATTGQVQVPTMVLPHSEAGLGTAPREIHVGDTCVPTSARAGCGSSSRCRPTSRFWRSAAGRSRRRSLPRSTAPASRCRQAPTRRCRGSIRSVAP